MVFSLAKKRIFAHYSPPDSNVITSVHVTSGFVACGEYVNMGLTWNSFAYGSGSCAKIFVRIIGFTVLLECVGLIMRKF